MSLDELVDEIVAFRNERDWSQFHNPKDLAAALSIEAAELQELFLWKNTEQVAQDLDEGKLHSLAAHEVADVLIYALLFCHAASISPIDAIQAKLAINADKYPADLAEGSAQKYTELDRDG